MVTAEVASLSNMTLLGSTQDGLKQDKLQNQAQPSASSSNNENNTKNNILLTTSTSSSTNTTTTTTDITTTTTKKLSEDISMISGETTFSSPGGEGVNTESESNENIGNGGNCSLKRIEDQGNGFPPRPRRRPSILSNKAMAAGRPKVKKSVSFCSMPEDRRVCNGMYVY